MDKLDVITILLAHSPTFQSGWEDGCRFALRDLPCEWDKYSGNAYGDAFYAGYHWQKEQM